MPASFKTPNIDWVCQGWVKASASHGCGLVIVHPYRPSSVLYITTPILNSRINPLDHQHEVSLLPCFCSSCGKRVDFLFFHLWLLLIFISTISWGSPAPCWRMLRVPDVLKTSSPGPTLLLVVVPSNMAAVVRPERGETLIPGTSTVNMPQHRRNSSHIRYG